MELSLACGLYSHTCMVKFQSNIEQICIKSNVNKFIYSELIYNYVGFYI